MLTIYRDEGGAIRTSAALELPGEVIWIDLLDPTDEERAFVESRAKIRVPPKEALSEIEASSRLIVERGVLFLSTPVVARGDSPEAYLSPAGFVLWPKLLVTVRYTPSPRSIALQSRSGRTRPLLAASACSRPCSKR